MYVLKGFASHDLLVNNAYGAVNTIGQLSLMGLTYAKDTGEYTHSSSANTKLTTFLSADSGVFKAPSVDTLDSVFSIINWIYTKSLNVSGQLYGDELAEEIIKAFQSSAKNIELGEIVTDGVYYIPEWVSFELNAISGSYFRIWFADASFRAQYDEFEITVVPPIENLDTFFMSLSKVKAAVDAVGFADSLTKIEVARGECPETVLRSMTYNYIYPANTAETVATNWAVLVYGVAGNNIDSIKDAIIEYILANSTYTREQWITILPDIFRRTEFVVAPNWTSYAIENREIAAGIYSPAIKTNEVLSLIKKAAPAYSDTHINSYSEIIAHHYKCLGLAVVGGAENRDSLYSLTDVYPDYLAVASTSQDFNRMSEASRDFCEDLENMIIIAEKMTKYSDIPSGYTRLIRDGVLYIVKSIGNIHYLVAAKSNNS